MTAGAGGVHDAQGGSDRWPWSGRWVSYADVRASAAVHALVVADRVVPVPWHGRAVVVWTGRCPQRVVALDSAGRRLDELLLARSG